MAKINETTPLINKNENPQASTSHANNTESSKSNNNSESVNLYRGGTTTAYIIEKTQKLEHQTTFANSGHTIFDGFTQIKNDDWYPRKAIHFENKQIVLILSLKVGQNSTSSINISKSYYDQEEYFDELKSLSLDDLKTFKPVEEELSNYINLKFDYDVILETNHNNSSESNLSENIITNNLDEKIERKTKQFIYVLKNTQEKIQKYIQFINDNINSIEPNIQKQVASYLNSLKYIHDILPPFNDNKKIKSNLWNYLAPLLIISGLGIRVMQRSFSVEVVSNPLLKNETFTEQVKTLSSEVYNALGIPANYAIGGVDMILAFLLSYAPFGLTDLIDLFTKKAEDPQIKLKNFNQLEKTIHFLEKCQEDKNYELLTNNAEVYEGIKSLCEKLVDGFLNKPEVKVSTENNNDNIVELNLLIDKKNEKWKTYIENNSWNKILKKSIYNTGVFLTGVLSNHLIITASSQYTAKTLNWPNYIETLMTIDDFISTLIRTVVMVQVNKHLVKKPFENIKSWFTNNTVTNIDTKNLFETIEEWVKKQPKSVQGIIFSVNFLIISIITNFVKTYAADISQNKGDWGAAWTQLNSTFWKGEMLGLGLLVVMNDTYNLKVKYKEVFKLFNKEQRKIINQLFSNVCVPQTNINYDSINSSGESDVIGSNSNISGSQTNTDIDSINSLGKDYVIGSNSNISGSQTNTDSDYSLRHIIVSKSSKVGSQTTINYGSINSSGDNIESNLLSPLQLS